MCASPKTQPARRWWQPSFSSSLNSTLRVRRVSAEMRDCRHLCGLPAYALCVASPAYMRVDARSAGPGAGGRGFPQDDRRDHGGRPGGPLAPDRRHGARCRDLPPVVICTLCLPSAASPVYWALSAATCMPMSERSLALCLLAHFWRCSPGPEDESRPGPDDGPIRHAGHDPDDRADGPPPCAA